MYLYMQFLPPESVKCYWKKFYRNSAQIFWNDLTRQKETQGFLDNNKLKTKHRSVTALPETSLTR